MPMLAANGETIHFQQTGSGLAVVLLHSLGTSGRMWKRQIEALNERYCVITLDCRGHGQSSANGEMTLAAAAQDLGALLDHLGCKACHITGLGMGSAVALYFNAQRPGVAQSMVFADFAAKPADNSSDMVTARREAIAYISMSEFASQYAAEHLMFTTPLDVQDEVAAMIAGINSKTYLQAMQQTLLEDFSPLVGAVKAPTLVLVGENDMVVTKSMAEAFAQSINGATLEVIPAASHLSNIDNPDTFNTALCKFLDAHG
jgi:3-oxoadipate enol-lactonase